jgi:hypothetical protein
MQQNYIKVFSRLFLAWVAKSSRSEYSPDLWQRFEKEDESSCNRLKGESYSTTSPAPKTRILGSSFEIASVEFHVIEGGAKLTDRNQ